MLDQAIGCKVEGVFVGHGKQRVFCCVAKCLNTMVRRKVKLSMRRSISIEVAVHTVITVERMTRVVSKGH